MSFLFFIRSFQKIIIFCNFKLFGRQLTFTAIPLSLSELPTLSHYKYFYFFLKKKPMQKGHQLKVCKSFEKKKQVFLGNVSFALVKKNTAREFIIFFAFCSIEFSAHFHTQLPNRSGFSSFPIKLQKIQLLVCLQIIWKFFFHFLFANLQPLFPFIPQPFKQFPLNWKVLGFSGLFLVGFIRMIINDNFFLAFWMVPKCRISQ